MDIKLSHLWSLQWCLAVALLSFGASLAGQTASAQYFNEAETKSLVIGEAFPWRAMISRSSQGEIHCMFGAEDMDDGSLLFFQKVANADFFTVNILYEEERSFSEQRLDFKLQIDANKPITLVGDLFPGHLVADISPNSNSNPGARVALFEGLARGSIIRSLDKDGTEINTWRLEGAAAMFLKSAECLEFF